MHTFLTKCLRRCAAAAAICLAASPPGHSAPPARNKIVRVVTVSQAGLDRSAPSLLESTLERLEQAASFRPDIAVLPEVFLPGPAEAVPGPITERLAEWAQRHSSYLIFGLKTTSGGKTHNSAVLLDRQGRIIGQYNKIYPTEQELREGISPGEAEPPVFETDFGRIAIQICFDVNWWDTWKRLKQRGAEIIFFPAAYPAARQLAALALANEVYIVSSTRSRRSRIYDITGEVLAVTGEYQQWAGASLPLGKRLFEIDFHVRKARELQKKYGSKIELKWRHEDDWFTLASLDPELTVDDLIREFGLTPLSAYRARAGEAVRKAR